MALGTPEDMALHGLHTLTAGIVPPRSRLVDGRGTSGGDDDGLTDRDRPGEDCLFGPTHNYRNGICEMAFNPTN